MKILTKTTSSWSNATQGQSPFHECLLQKFHYILSGNNCKLTYLSKMHSFFTHITQVKLVYFWNNNGFKIILPKMRYPKQAHKQRGELWWMGRCPGSATFPKSFLIQYLAQIQYTRYVTFYPNLHNPVNFIPFGMMRYSFFLTSTSLIFMSIICIWLAYWYFLFVSKQSTDISLCKNI